MPKKIQSILFILSFLGDFGNSLLLITSVAYGVTLSDDPLLVGMIGAAYGITYLITPAILGWLGDKFPRKMSLLIASSSQILIALYFLVFAHSPIRLIVGQILLGIAYGFFWPSIEAYASETSYVFASIPPEQAHKKGILSFCIAWSIGYVVGPLFAGIFGDYFLPGAFITGIVIYIIGFCLILIKLPTLSSEKSSTVVNISQNPPVKNIKGTQRFLIELVIAVLLYAGISKALYTYFTDYALDAYGLDWSNSLTGWILFSFGLGRTAFFVVNFFSLRIKSSMKLVLYAFLGIGLCILCIPFFQNAIIIAVIMFMGGVGAGIVYSSTLDLLLHQEQQSKGAKAGLFESMVGLGSVSFPIAAGAIARISQMTVPFYWLAALTTCVFLVLFFLEYKPSR